MPLSCLGHWIAMRFTTDILQVSTCHCLWDLWQTMHGCYGLLEDIGIYWCKENRIQHSNLNSPSRNETFGAITAVISNLLKLNINILMYFPNSSEWMFSEFLRTDSVLFWHLGCAIGGVIRNREAVVTAARGRERGWRLANKVLVSTIRTGHSLHQSVDSTNPLRVLLRTVRSKNTDCIHQ
jgi:hypothetical protein